jgi:hypothetical protein
LMTAWNIAKYIDSIAESGKAIYNIPMYDNVWLMEQNWWAIPGESYPSGGAVAKVLDIYKWFTPHLDIIAPDNYQLDSNNFKAVCASYARDDNPLFMPETIGNRNMFRAIADYNSLANFFFGLEFILAQDGSVRPECQTIVDSMRCTAAVIPLLLKYQGTGKIHAAIQEEQLYSQLLELGDYTGLVEFGEKRGPVAGTDWRHPKAAWLGNVPMTANPAYGLVIQASGNEFYMVGANCRLFLRPKPTLERIQPQLMLANGTARTFAYIVRVDEGHFDKNDEFVSDRRRNGDEIGHNGLWVEPDIGVLRVITCD